MCMLVLYISITFVMMYTEVINCYRDNMKLNLTGSLLFSLLWVISIPYAIYLVWKEGKNGN